MWMTFRTSLTTRKLKSFCITTCATFPIVLAVVIVLDRFFAQLSTGQIKPRCQYLYAIIVST